MNEALQPVHTLYTSGAIRDSENKLIGFWDGHRVYINQPNGKAVEFVTCDAELVMDLVAQYA